VHDHIAIRSLSGPAALIASFFDIEPHLQRRLRVVLRAVEDISRNAGRHLCLLSADNERSERRALSRARFDQRPNMLKKSAGDFMLIERQFHR
jgi:hypothetical protein